MGGELSVATTTTSSPQKPSGVRDTTSRRAQAVSGVSGYQAQAAALSPGGDSSSGVTVSGATEAKTDEKQPEITSMINSKYAYLVDPEDDYKVKRADSQTTVTDGAAWLRDPDNGFDPISKEGGGKATVPKGTLVTVVEEKKTPRGTMGHVTWEGGSGWTSRGNYRTRTGVKMKVPNGTKVEVKEQSAAGGKTYTRVTWAGGEGWVESRRVTTTDLTYATRLDEQGRYAGREVTGSKTSRIPYEKDAKAKDTQISAKEARNLARGLVYRINNGSAWVRTAGEFEKTPDKLKYNSWVLIEQTVEHEGSKFARVTKMDGTEVWTSAGNMSPRTMARTDLDGITNEAVKQKVIEAYGGNVDALVGSKNFTPNQQDLIGQAKKFVGDSSAQAAYSDLVIPGGMMVRNGETLNQDLINRLSLFVKFVRHAKLMQGEPKVWDGVRSRKRAHEISVRWTLNPKSGQLESVGNRAKMARKIVDLNGKDTVNDIEWASASQVKALKDGIEGECLDGGSTHEEEAKVDAFESAWSERCPHVRGPRTPRGGRRAHRPERTPTLGAACTSAACSP